MNISASSTAEDHREGIPQRHQCQVVIAGHAFVQNLRQAHYELAVQEPVACGWPSRSTSRR
jgi:hypothetical protein